MRMEAITILKIVLFNTNLDTSYRTSYRTSEHTLTTPQFNKAQPTLSIIRTKLYNDASLRVQDHLDVNEES